MKFANKQTDIALIGMSCRLPGGAKNPREFWEFLMQGGDGIVDVPADRWDVSAYYDKDKEKKNKMYVNRGGFLDAIDTFDPQFFGISPKEAPYIDPQHRWLLELTYEVFENAGIKPSELKGSDTAVYVGQFMHDYEQVLLDSSAHNLMSSHSATGPSMTLTANRISYVFDFIGPSVTLDTACSSSLVALDMACKSIINGDSSLAIAGGVNILLRPELTMSICKASMLSPDGRCKSFDASANGYVRSEGAGLVLLKSRADAERDGDNILAIIKASGINQDGQTVGITVPNGESQKVLLQKSLSKADISADQVQYAEAHGTGTAVGDPIEVNALASTLGDRDKTLPKCVIGSVKSNIGHTEAAAGVAGLMKTVLAMNAGIIPQNIHYHTTNPAIDLAALNVDIADETKAWPDRDGVRRCAIVNSFGFGGTNANVVIEQAENKVSSVDSQQPIINSEYKLLPISAKTEKALRDQALKFSEFLNHSSHNKLASSELHNICYSASCRREHHKYRLAISANNKEKMLTALQKFIDGTADEHIANSASVSLNSSDMCFVFSGMGPQWHTMGSELYQSELVYRDMFNRCSEALEKFSGWSLYEKVFTGDDPDEIHETHYAQPAIFATQVSLAALLRSWGITPTHVVGHSAGEVAAAYVAGAISFDDAISVIFHRSRLQHTTEGRGKMLAVGVSESTLRPYIEEFDALVSIAAINSEQAITLSGDADALALIAGKLEDDDHFARFLNVGVPYHSPVMDELKEDIIESLRDIRVSTPHTPLYSTVSGTLTKEGDWGAEYWADNVREAVMFKHAIDAITTVGVRTFLEIAPHAALSGSIAKNLKAAKLSGVVVSTLKRHQDGNLSLSKALANLHVGGYDLPWEHLYSMGGQSVWLPNYAWQHERFWCESEDAMNARLRNLNRTGGMGENIHPLVGSSFSATTPLWYKQLDLQELAYIADHLVDGSVVYPGAAYVEMGLQLARLSGQDGSISLENIQFEKAFYIDEETTHVLESTFDRSDSRYQISVQGSEPGEWQKLSRGSVNDIPPQKPSSVINIEALQSKLTQHIDHEHFYHHCHTLGLTYEGCFKAVQQAWHLDGESLVEVELDASLVQDIDQYLLHPVILDGAFQSVFPNLEHGFLPVKITTLNYHSKHNHRVYAHLKTTKHTSTFFRGDLFLYCETGELLVELLGVELKAIQSDDSNNDSAKDKLYEYTWHNDDIDAETVLENTPVSTDKVWLVFSYGSKLGSHIAHAIEKKGGQAIQVKPGDTLKEISQNHHELPFTNRENINSFIERYAPKTFGVISTLDIGSENIEALDGDAILKQSEQYSLALLYLAQALNKVDWPAALKIFLVSQNAHQVLSTDKTPDPRQGLLWGFGRVLGSEHPEHELHLVDLPQDHNSKDILRLVNELYSANYEQEIALRSEGRFVHRLFKLDAPRLSKHWENTTYNINNTDFIVKRDTITQAIPDKKASIYFVQQDSVRLNNDEILIETDYATCADIEGKTIECVGKVKDVGTQVTQFALGDIVYGIAHSDLGSTLIGKANLFTKKPDWLSNDKASSIPLAYTLAYHIVFDVAHINTSSSILVHQADSAIGLAVVSLVKSKGATVFTTYYEEKGRDKLEKMGVAGCYSAHDFNFISLIRSHKELKQQDGQFDLIVSALGGQFAHKSAELIRPFGQYVDLCPALDKSKHLLPILAHRNAGYLPLDSSAWIRNSSAEVSFKKVTDLFTTEIDIAYPSTNVLSIEDIQRDATTSENTTTKTLYSFHSKNISVLNNHGATPVKPGYSYLVTGGLGGLGLEIMHWLAEQGAESIVLVGRRKPSEHASAQIAALTNANNCLVTVKQADVMDDEQLTQLIASIGNTLLPLGGVIHSAGVLDDGVINQQSQEKFEKVLGPKIKGAWNLHQKTQHLPLHMFITFSSIAAVVGWAGQSNYAAANSFMDTLAHYRRSIGLAALSINWGPWASAGMAADLEDRDVKRMNDAGMKALTNEQGLLAMKTLLQHSVTHAGVFDQDWSLMDKLFANIEQKTVFSKLYQPSSTEEELNFSQQLASVSNDVRETLLTEKLKDQLASVLGIDTADSIEADKSVFEYGMNSLMSMEFKNQVQGILKVKLPGTLVMKHPTIAGMVSAIITDYLSNTVSMDTDDVLIEVWNPAMPEIIKHQNIHGDVPLNPMASRWYRQKKPMFFSIGFMLEIEQSKFDINVLQQTLDILMAYHEGSRMRVCQGENNFKQHIAEFEPAIIRHADFSKFDYVNGVDQMHQHIHKTLSDFKLGEGEHFYRICHYKLNDENPDRVLIMFHHFISDGLALRAFGTNFDKVYHDVFDNKPVALPSKSMSLQNWNKKVYSFAHTEAVAQLPYWMDVIEYSKACRIPKKMLDNEITIPEEKVYHESIYLLEPDVYKNCLSLCRNPNFEFADIITHSAISAFSNIIGKSAIWADVVGHGRSGIFDGVDMQGVFGVFSQCYSAVFEQDETLSLIDQLADLAKQREHAPNAGLGLYALKYLNDDQGVQEKIHVDDLPQFFLNYQLLQYQTLDENGWITIAKEGIGDPMPKTLDAYHKHPVELVANMQEHGLELTLFVLKDVIPENIVEQLRNDMADNIRKISKLFSVLQNENESVI